MRRRSLIGSLLALLTAGALTLLAAPATATETEFIIGQFNMAGGNSKLGTHGMEAPDALVTSVQSRGSRLAFVTIAEGCRDWMQRLRDRLPDYDVALEPIKGGTDNHPVRCYHQRDNDQGDQVDAVLYRKDFLVDPKSEAFDLGSPRSTEHRMMLCVKSAPRGVVVCSAHLSADKDPTNRRNEARVAAGILRDHYSGNIRILGGDFNDDPLSAVADNFYLPGYEHGARGEFKEVNSPCKNEVKEGIDHGTHTDVGPMQVHTPCRSGTPTFPRFLGLADEKIDYLFVPPSVTVHDSGPTSAKFSDHLPLWASVTIPAH